MNSNKIPYWKHRLHEIVYEADTRAGRRFDLILLILILLSVVLVMLESIAEIHMKYESELDIMEWIITGLFTAEYITRLIAIKKPLSYVFSFYGIIDLLSTIPKYISLIMVGTDSLIALRALRLLRVFRILKITRFIGESNFLVKALYASRAKISVFLFAVFILCIIFGTLMYLIEGETNGFTSIPRSIYWAIVTMTTVGYGDIAPQTPLGQLLASLIMIMGYGIIAVPTGIVSSEMTHQTKNVDTNTQACLQCNTETHKDGAIFCHHCGTTLNDEF
ncbi:MAG: ion transporter [Flavobacteriales bacterium]|jgi:voltage-gated potassium channel|nr:ion transporter [Flavobacteriaceae bacterium]MDO7581248.1 ion transporter [Flavobacteriaceae bacterium]MDO7591967.1 ion transporter [Flavobacteriaceae bacterium]MDO7598572.1 ion transporter [Flavobacteriaceae bacterium]MDO7603158.1 ion transporter [Flavobacteriaceae bacterium]|tara:strand:+ start:910 stop:1740 length:831 start_codon:yes stop_codon:yes gene_type:complete